ncbi:MAG: TolC family protein [Bryobacteraceae bacterium]
MSDCLQARCGAAAVLCLGLGLLHAQQNPAPGAGATFSLVDAVMSTLVNHPLLQIQQEQVNVFRALKQQATGQFDTLVTSGVEQRRVVAGLTALQKLQALQSGVDTGSQRSNLTGFTVSGSKLFRNGISIGPFLDVNRNTDNLINSGGLNQSQFGFQVNIPLLRGRGREVVAAQETSAGLDIDASLLDLNQTIAELLTNTAISYWNAVAAELTFDVAVGSEQRGQTFVENVRDLIDADKAPRNELNQVMANFADRTSSRIAAQQRLIETRQALALAMGLSPQNLPAIGRPGDALPTGEGATTILVDPGALQSYITLALARRADVLAAEKRIASTDVLRAAAKNLILPRVDLQLSSGYSGLREGRGIQRYLTIPVQGLNGPDLSAGLSYSFPPSNNVARGQLAQAEASVRQAQLRVLDTSRGVSASVVNAAQGVVNAIDRLGKARESVEYYQNALTGEREKFRIGLGSLVDILTIEDRLTGAQSSLVQAQLAYATVLARFRFATGTLIAPDQAIQSVDRNVFLTLPDEARRTP